MRRLCIILSLFIFSTRFIRNCDRISPFFSNLEHSKLCISNADLFVRRFMVYKLLRRIIIQSTSALQSNDFPDQFFFKYFLAWWTLITELANHWWNWCNIAINAVIKSLSLSRIKLSIIIIIQFIHKKWSTHVCRKWRNNQFNNILVEICDNSKQI